MIGRRSSRVKLTKKATGPRGFDDYQVKLGDIMRGERATRGKSLLDVQRDLKIKTEYIMAVENSDPLVFDTPGFIAGYVRSYAKYLGMDPEEAFVLFCSESGFKPVHGMDSKGALPNRAKKVDSFDGTKNLQPSRLNATSSSFTPVKESLLNKVDFKALISSVVLVFFLGSLAYGFYNVVQKIQRVQISAVEQPPLLQSDLDPLIPSMISDSSSGQNFIENNASYSRIYRPEALDTPILERRDGPISGLDPNTLGVFGSVNTLKLSSALKLNSSVGSMIEPKKIPELKLIKALPDRVQLLATEGVWMRIKDASGTILYEQIMNARNLFDVPSTETAPVIDRAGNSGSLFFVVNGKLYGPAGEKSRTIKNVSLSAKNIINTYDLHTPNIESPLYSFLRGLEAKILNE